MPIKDNTIYVKTAKEKDSLCFYPLQISCLSFKKSNFRVICVVLKIFVFMFRETKIQMTVNDAERLITYLNDASDMLSRHVDELQYMVTYLVLSPTFRFLTPMSVNLVLAFLFILCSRNWFVCLFLQCLSAISTSRRSVPGYLISNYPFLCKWLTVYLIPQENGRLLSLDEKYVIVISIFSSLLLSPLKL